MATVTIKNVSSAAVYVRDLQDSIEAGETITFTRSLGDLTGASALNGFIANGTLQIVSVVTTDAETFWAAGGSPLVSTAALTLYVATTGNDLNNGLTESTPLLSITAALRKAPFLVKAGFPVNINVAAGAYTERIDVPPLILNDSVSVVAPAMVPTNPTTGLASGTFDAVFGTQAFPHRAVVTGAGWTIGDLIGGWFVEILSGTNTGSRYPIINNTATTIDLAFPCNTGSLNMQSVQFRLVKPAVTVTGPATDLAINANAVTLGQQATAVSTATNYVRFANITFVRGASASLGLIRMQSGAYLRFDNCALLDSASGGSQMVLVQGQSNLRMDDTLIFRSALRNNTNLVSMSVNSSFTANRYAAYGGNFALSASQMCSVNITNGFGYGQDVCMSVGSISRAFVSSFGVDAANAGASVSEGSSLTMNSCTIKNSLVAGLMAGFSGFAGSFATAPVSSGFVFFQATVIDTCVRGIIMGASCQVNLNLASTISNCTSHGVNMAPTLRSGSNVLISNPSVVMTGNAVDFTVDGTATLSLAALRALSPKRSVDAAATFNRLVEV